MRVPILMQMLGIGTDTDISAALLKLKHLHPQSCIQILFYALNICAKVYMHRAQIYSTRVQEPPTS